MLYIYMGRTVEFTSETRMSKWVKIFSSTSRLFRV